MSSKYSKTPLAKKLGIKEGHKMLFYNQPNHYFDLFEGFPDDIEILAEANSETLDFIHLFCTTQDELIEKVSHYKKAMKKNGLLWISWPKGKSEIKTDLKRDWIRAYILQLGLVDVKVAAIDEDWSALKFVYRVKDR